MLLVGATNRPEDLDKAVLDRMDETVEIGLPDLEARKRMVKFIHDNGFATLQKDGSFKLNKSAVKNADFDDGDAVVEYLNDQDAWYVDEEQAPAIVKALTPAVLLEQLADKIENPKSGQDVVVDFAAYNAAMQRVDAAIQARIAG